MVHKPQPRDIIFRAGSIITVSVLGGSLFLRIPPPIFADNLPTPPSKPVAPDKPTAPAPPDKPDTPSQPQQAPPTQQSQKTDNGQHNTNQPSDMQPTKQTVTPSTKPETDNQLLQTPATGTPTPKTAEGANLGNTSVSSGNATTNSVTATKANQNTTTQTQNTNPAISVTPIQKGTLVKNVENGSGGVNTASTQSTHIDTTGQNNTASANNTLNQETVTGKNNASLNVGNSNVQTGDANTSGTAITSLNTNINGVMVNQFDVNDNHNGDIVLNLSSASHCISGCGNSPNVIQNVANGKGSQNSASASSSTTNATFQNNDATVGSNVTLGSDSGNNSANDNTGGNSTIKTGNANTTANVLTFANNNIDGRVVYSTVNIYGNLAGDIIIPQQTMDAVPSASPAITENTRNGTGSQNTATASLSASNATFQNNDADIVNNLQLRATAGNNHTNNDTGGNAAVQTGQSSIDAKVLNVTNSNVNSGDVWLVIVNQAGKWIGKILGAPDGAHSAGSSGVTIATDNNGNVTASNNGNGSGSHNSTDATVAKTDTTTQNNKAKIVNNVHLSANTGGNSASNNTNGNSIIQTGNAHIIANLVNFVNNNIKGTGKLFVTVVNVFGSWIGDFVTPGQQKNKQASYAITQAQIIAPIATPTPIAIVSETLQTTTQTTAATTGNYYPRYSLHYTLQSYNPRFYQASLHPNRIPGLQAPQNLLRPMLQTVAGARTEKQAVTVNLAWILFVTPLIILSIYLKKRLFIYK